MDAVEQSSRVVQRATGDCVVLTLREAEAIRDELIDRWTLPECVSAALASSDLGRAWRVLNAQIDSLNEGPERG